MVVFLMQADSQSDCERLHVVGTLALAAVSARSVEEHRVEGHIMTGWDVAVWRGRRWDGCRGTARFATTLEKLTHFRGRILSTNIIEGEYDAAAM